MKIGDPDDPNLEMMFGPLSEEQMKEALALARAAFTAEDLQRYTEPLEGTPLEEIIQELEETQKQFDQRSP
jgi:hypothetical protein